MINLDPTKRYDMQLTIRVVNGNPNGDPERDGAPRINPEGMGIITGESVKRKVRDYVADYYGEEEGYDIFIKQGSVIQKNIDDVIEKGNVKAKDKAGFREQVISRFYDVRMFGGVFTGGKKVEAQQGLRGALQIGMGTSEDKIAVNYFTITRCASDSETKKGEKEETEHQTMGRKAMVGEAIYHIPIHYIPVNGLKNSVTTKDLEIAVEALEKMWMNSYSGMRGEIYFKELRIWEHSNPKGDMSPDRIWETEPTFVKK